MKNLIGASKGGMLAEHHYVLQGMASQNRQILGKIDRRMIRLNAG
jgi:hypothetical protein